MAAAVQGCLPSDAMTAGLTPPLCSSLQHSSASSPLSRLSKTPSLPSSPPARPDAAGRYPSPMSSVPPGNQLPVKLGVSVADDGPRLAKKRRLAPPRERSTSYLDLIKPHEEFTNEDSFHLKRLLSALRNKKKIVVIAGAGISVSAGIPDFRSSAGLFATARNQHSLKASGKHLFDASVYKHDSSTQSFHTMVREMADLTKKASPTPFHQLLASLAKEGRLLRLYSQNIDCIDTSMEPLRTTVPLEPKGPWPPTIQLHGSLEKMVCTKCSDLQPFDGHLFHGPAAPLCPICQAQDEVRTNFAGKRSHGIGRLRPRFVLYNEFNPDEEAIGNVARADLKARPDAVIVVGTTLKVPGTRRLVKEMCQVARGRKDGFTAWINIDPEPKGTEFKGCWDLVVRSRSDNVARFAALPPHDCEIGDDYLVSSKQYADKRQRKNGIAVGISRTDTKLSGKATPRHSDTARFMPTPCPSPPASMNTQTTISFGNQAAGNLPPVARAPKPRGPRTRLPGAARVPVRESIKDAFRLDKNIVGRNAEKKVALEGLPPLRPTLASSIVGHHLTFESIHGRGGGIEAKRQTPTTPAASTESLHQEATQPKFKSTKPLGRRER